MERWKALTLQSLADGIMEADLRWLEERRRPSAERRDAIVTGMRKKIEATVDRIEAEPPTGLTIGTIAMASALAHLDFRFPDVPWRPGRPRLDAWFDTFAARPSMVATKFVDAY
jgi:glutathione S-transferase